MKEDQAGKEKQVMVQHRQAQTQTLWILPASEMGGSIVQWTHPLRRTMARKTLMSPIWSPQLYVLAVKFPKSRASYKSSKYQLTSLS